ncbi:MAG: hypothetical protein AB7T03_05830 [Bacilli bacterium]
MKQTWVKKYLFPAIIVLSGGIFMSAFVYALYYLTFLGIEAIFFKNNGEEFHMDVFRRSFAVVLVGLFLFLSSLKWSRLLKALTMVGPLAMLFVTIILGIYEKPFIGLGINLFITFALSYFFCALKITLVFLLVTFGCDDNFAFVWMTTPLNISF